MVLLGMCVLSLVVMSRVALYVRVPCYQGKGARWNPRAGVVWVAGVVRGLWSPAALGACLRSVPGTVSE